MDDANQLVISSLGMCTPIGHDVVTACAAMRAGIVRPCDLPFSALDEVEGEEVPVIGYPLRGITDGYQGEALYLRIGVRALKDLLRYGGLTDQAAGYWADTALFVCVSEARNDDMGILNEVLATVFPTKLLEQVGLPIPPHQISVLSIGHAGVIHALSQARELIPQGSLKRVIILGIDSLVNGEALAYYDEQGLLKSVGSPAGLMPGEAGAAILVETAQDAQEQGTTPDTSIGAVVTGFSDHHFLSDSPDFGGHLAQTMVMVMRTTQRVDSVYCDLNGEGSRAMDWGSALAQVQGEMGYVPTRILTPAESLGDTGAASGAVAICAAARSFARNYARGESCLVCSSSESGEVGTVLLVRAARDTA